MHATLESALQFCLRFLQRRSIQVAIATALLCIGLQLLGLDQLLRFDRQLLQNGNFWLILTGNFVHLNWSHLTLNLVGLLLVVLLVWDNFNAIEWLLIILICSLGVGIGLYVRDPGVGWYVGFSGTLHGLILAGAIADLRRFPLNAAALLVLVCVKLFWEQRFGAMPGSESVAGGKVVVNSHLYGAITGAIICLPLLVFNSRQRARKSQSRDNPDDR